MSTSTVTSIEVVSEIPQRQAFLCDTSSVYQHTYKGQEKEKHDFVDDKDYFFSVQEKDKEVVWYTVKDHLDKVYEISVVATLKSILNDMDYDRRVKWSVQTESPEAAEIKSYDELRLFICAMSLGLD